MEVAFLLSPTGDFHRFGEALADAERSGYAAAWVPDQGFHRDPFVAAAYAATQTSRMLIGLGVANPYTRHPALVARAAATLAELSAGRFVLGIGSGERRLRDLLGTPRARFLPSARVALTALRDLFQGREVTAESPLFRINRVRLDFRVKHDIPMYLATREVDGFRLAGELAHGLILGDMCEPASVRGALQYLREGAGRAARDASRLQVVGWAIIVVTEQVAAAKGLLRPMIAQAIATMMPDGIQLLRLGDDVVTPIRAALRNGAPAISEALLPDSLIDKLAIVGPPSFCVEKIRALADAGVTQIVVRMPVDLAGVLDFADNLRIFAREVMPHVRGG